MLVVENKWFYQRFISLFLYKQETKNLVYFFQDEFIM